MPIRFASLALLATLPALATADDLRSRVDAVTVYPFGATVTRVATVTLAAGVTDLRMTGLVRSIDANNLQVEVAGDGIQIGQVSFGAEQQREEFNEDIVALQADIHALNRQITEIDDASNAAKLRLTFLEGIAQGYAKEASVEGGRGTADVNTWRAALELIQTETVSANRMIRDNEDEKVELLKDLSVMKRNLAQLRGDTLATAVVEFSVNAPRALDTEIRLHYFQEIARWAPRYEARLDSNDGTLRLTQQAEVYQETDEDWSDVQLVLSTSRPSGQLVAPELRSEFLDIAEPAPAPARQRSTAHLMQQADMDAPLEEIVVTGSPPRAQVGSFAVNYEVPGRTSISNATDDAVTVELSRLTFDTDLVTQVVPRRSTQAFLAARFVYDRPQPLYSGEMAVFVDGVFSGVTQMPTALPQSDVVLPMGQDRRVEVTSESQGGQGGTSGLVGRRRTEVTDYVFEINNRRGAASAVEVLDRIPVSRNRDVEVEVPRTATPPDERDLDDQPGLLMWKRELGPGESWRIRHQYSISYPAKFVLVRQ